MSNARRQLLNYIIDVERCVAAGAENIAGIGRLAEYDDLLRELAKQVPTLGPTVELHASLRRSDERDAATHLLHLVMQGRQLRAAISKSADPDLPLMEITPSGPWTTAMPLDQLYRDLANIRNSYNRREALLNGSLQAPDDMRLINEWLADAINTGRSAADTAVDVLLPMFGAAVANEFAHHGFTRNEVTKARRLVGLCRIDPEAGKQAIISEHPHLAHFLE